MGWFRRTPKKPRQPRIVVRVQYRKVPDDYPLPDPNNLKAGYAYLWTLPDTPITGMPVIVPPNQRAVIVGFDTDYDGELKSVIRLAKR